MKALNGPVEKGTEADLRREMIGFAAQGLMELDVERLTGRVMASEASAGWRSARAAARTAGRSGPATSSKAEARA